MELILKPKYLSVVVGVRTDFEEFIVMPMASIMFKADCRSSGEAECSSQSSK